MYCNRSCQLHSISMYQPSLCFSSSSLPWYTLTVLMGCVFRQAAVFTKIAYCLPAWFGLCMAGNHALLDSFLRRCAKLRYCSTSNPSSVSSVFEDAEDSLFHKIISNKHHVLRPYLTDRAGVHYKLRNQNHNKTLIPKTVDLSDRDFLIRCLYKCSY